MADLFFVGSGAISLPAGTQLCTLAGQTPARPVITLSYLSVSFNGVSASATPVNCIIARLTGATTPSGSAVPANYGPSQVSNPGGPTSAATWACPSTASPGVWTTAPTQGAIVWEQDISPTTGQPLWWPLGQEIRAAANAWSIGVFLTAPAVVAAKTSLYYSE